MEVIKNRSLVLFISPLRLWFCYILFETIYFLATTWFLDHINLRWDVCLSVEVIAHLQTSEWSCFNLHTTGSIIVKLHCYYIVIILVISFFKKKSLEWYIDSSVRLWGYEPVPWGLWASHVYSQQHYRNNRSYAKYVMQVLSVLSCFIPKSYNFAGDSDLHPKIESQTFFWVKIADWSKTKQHTCRIY